MAYTLYNKRLDKKFKDKYGLLWCFSDLKTTQGILESLREYLVAVNVPKEEFNNFIVIDAETGEEINV